MERERETREGFYRKSLPIMIFKEDPLMGSADEAVKSVHKDYVHGLTWVRGDLIGKGGFGSVYLATSQGFSPFPPQMAVKSARLCDSGSLKLERQFLSVLHKSPYIIKCFADEYTTGENGEEVYNLLLEYASGGSLRDLIRKSRGFGLPESEVRVYARSILRGLKHVHDAGLVHVDIKPDNVLLVPCDSTKFVAKICDFGLAKRANQGKSDVRGTAMYISPEAAATCIQEAPADVWAVGCVVLELLTGKRVWEREKHWSTWDFLYNIGNKLGSPKIPSGISEEGKEFLKGCFARNAAERLTVDVLLKLPFVSDLDDETDGGSLRVPVSSEESELLRLNLLHPPFSDAMEANYYKGVESEEPKGNLREPDTETDADLSLKILTARGAKVRPNAEEEKGIPRHGNSRLIQPMEDEPSVVYLGTVANHVKMSRSTDETINNHKRRRLMSRSSIPNSSEVINAASR